LLPNIFLLREARARFNKAISIEHSNRLILAYLGLSLCHFHLGDERNSVEALAAIKNGSFHVPKTKIKKVVRDYTLAPIILSVIIFPNMMGNVHKNIKEDKRDKIQKLKRAIEDYLNSKE